MIKTANLIGTASRTAGGLFNSVRRLVQSLAETGMDVRVFAGEDRFSAEDLAAWQPVGVQVFQPTWPESFGYSRQYLPALEEFAPDLTHTHGIWMYQSVATNLYCRRTRSPYLISPHGMLDPWAIRNSRWRKMAAYLLYEEAHLRGARCLRALCESEAQSIRQLGLKSDICIIPNAIDLPDLTKIQKSEVRNQKSGRKMLLYLGRIHPKKGLINLLKAWAVIQKAESGKRKAEYWMLAIAGWDQGGHEDELKRLATELGIQWTDVRDKADTGKQKTGIVSAFNFQLSGFSLLFLGPQFDSAKDACYANCDAFILPSFSEGLPMVVLEAWAHGKPVVMTPECNLPEGFAANAAIRIETSVESIADGLREMFVLSESTSPLRFDRGESGATLAHRMGEGLGVRDSDEVSNSAPPSQLVARCSALQVLGKNGHNLVIQRFTWPRVGQEMANVYHWMLGGGPKPDSVL